MKNLDFRPVDGSKIKFQFSEFNSKRHARGIEAARFYIDEGMPGGRYMLWMNKNHIQANIKEFGEHPELLKALDVYNNSNRS